MILKLLVLAGVLYLVYKVLFRRKLNSTDSNTKNDEVDTMIECPTCKVYTARDDAILSNGKYYCSKECLGK